METDYDAWHCDDCHGAGWTWQKRQVAERETDVQEFKIDCETCGSLGWQGPDAEQARHQAATAVALAGKKLPLSIRCGSYQVAILDYLDYSQFVPNSGLISRLVVPEGYRRQGLGQRLLNTVMDDADARGRKLFLEINPYGDMNWKQLRHWYKKNGFHEVERHFLVQVPQSERLTNVLQQTT